MEAIKRKAIELAVRQAIVIKGDPFSVYESLVSCVDSGLDFSSVSIRERLEGMAAKELLEHIERESEAILKAFQDVLDSTKAGILIAAENDDLDSDMSSLDMDYMHEIGCKECAA